ncbi:MAG: hypothetical protein CMK32_08110 [Porticoccaceae bacterium]|nr:hypothetical protein [Porticoccaceae bacterium]
MPYYAELDEDSQVLRVIVADSKEWCENRLGGTWVETKIDAGEQYAGIGFQFDKAHPKRFAPDWSSAGQTQQPDGSWIYNTQGQFAAHNGKIWTNLLPSGTPNVWEPGVANWREYQLGVNYTVWLQPTGAFDAYPSGYRVEHDEVEYESNIDANTTTPGGPGGQWTRLTPLPALDEWAPNTSYVIGDERTYNGTTYRCIQAHTSIVGWQPPNVPALWQAV